MKIRTGFVSNSSSSSFCILGVETTSDLYDKVANIPGDKRTPDSLDCESGISIDDTYYIGYAPERMREDETLSQFKNRMVAAAEKDGIVIDKKDIDWHTDGGYNG